MNEWIELPITGAIEYFSRMIVTAHNWAILYGYLFGVCGIAWSGFKVMMSRMTVKDLWWDTLFKWVGFILLLSIYPTMTAAFMSIGNEIGLKAGGGKTEIINGLKELCFVVDRLQSCFVFFCILHSLFKRICILFFHIIVFYWII